MDSATSPRGLAGQENARLGLTRLDGIVSTLFAGGISPSTATAYRSGQRRYLTFCAEFGLQPLPLQEEALCQITAFLMKSSLTYTSIHLVRFLQISAHLPDPSLSSHPRLNYVLKGIRHCRPLHSRPRRLPITISILKTLYGVWSASPSDYTRAMLWAACCLGFFGFLRSGEFTCASTQHWPSLVLSLGDMAVNSHTNPQYLIVHLRQSKTDPFCTGF